ncbi:MAG TPA: hypothetical protein VK162_02675, partial [Streptosporangiaceae bacterium]|nr:hypothetical protein [Streptosporangiaceae bacterium]
MTSTIFEPRVRPRGGRPLVAERLKIPRPGVPVLQRPRVTELIRRAATRRITLTCGPAGSGKTVACALWAAAARPAGRVAWLALDQDDRQPGRLWDDLWGAMASAPGIPGEITGERPRPEGEPYPLRLAAAAERLNAPVTLVIDNVQELAGCEALASLDLLIRTGPPALHLLLVGRHATGLQVARQRVDGELAEIGPADLACSPDEVERYFATLGTDLQQSQLDELVSRTEGWMTGLRLAALHATAAGPAAPPWRLSGDEPAVADYLRAEVLSAQSASRRLFLLRTCITDRIGGSLADAMTAGSDGAAVLDQLWRENVMIRHADRQDGAAESADYAYHPLLLDLLRAELRTELPDEIPALAGRAARWQAAHGMK